MARTFSARDAKALAQKHQDIKSEVSKAAALLETYRPVRYNRSWGVDALVPSMGPYSLSVGRK